MNAEPPPRPIAASLDGSLTLRCESCGAELTLAPHLRTVTCPYCDSPSVIERVPTQGRPDPTFVVPFVLDKDHAVAQVEAWIGRRGWFAHSGLATAAIERTRGVYLPAYLYSALAHSEYTTDIGEHYTVTETYTTTNSKGQTTTHTRTRIETEWRDLRGEHAFYLLDVIVTASSALGNAELECVEPFDLRALRRYDPALIAGWIAEDPSLDQARCLALAHDEGVERVGRAIAAFMPGDTHRDLRYSSRFDDETIDLLLLPVWVFALRYARDGRLLRILVNGQTGEVAGDVPKSATKIALAIVIATLLLLWLTYIGLGGR